MNETLTRAKAHETRIRELEEEVQANDRVETLEKSLKGTQDRAESLEFQLSKSKQVSAPDSLCLFSPFVIHSCHT